MDCNSHNSEQPLRFEFRIFGQGFGRERDEIRKRSPCTGNEEVLDIYLVTAANEINNVKIRERVLDIKVLTGVERGLELWKPCLKIDFPISGSDGVTDLFHALAVQAPALSRIEVDVQDLMTQIIWPHPEILVAEVCKQRSFYQIGECRVEIDELLVNGAAIQSISLECEDAAEILRIQQLLGMKRYLNINYLIALKRIMGIVPLLSQQARRYHPTAP